MRPRKPEPIKHCAACGSPLARKRINGRLEDLGVFGRRRFCGRRCMGDAMLGVIKVPNAANSRRQASRMNTGECARCGRTCAWTRLYVHHRDDNPVNNDQANLETLCGSCHRRHHDGKEPAPCRLCPKPARKAGLCETHYTRKQRHGDPLLKKFRVGTAWVLRKDGVMATSEAGPVDQSSEV